ncbi:MAG: endolytic transglycosylase MltG [Oscillospiraceae bacterium]|nr:endolytic transglycosylase MltG [Oscillospiraceae bacterium]
MAKPKQSNRSQLARQSNRNQLARRDTGARGGALSVTKVGHGRTPVPLFKRNRLQTGCLTGILYFLFVVGISAILASLAWTAIEEVMGFSKPDGEVTVIVEEDDTISDIANKLLEKDLIGYPWIFKLFASVTGAEEKIVPGTYVVALNLDYMAIVNAMKKDSQFRSEVKVTIPEGFTLKKIFARLDERGVCTEEELWMAARTHDFQYSFLEGLPKTVNRLEGFLFPDTYDFYLGDDPVKVLQKMLSNFNNKLTDKMRERADEMGLSIYQAVTIAAMIEREAADVNDAYLVSSVIHNRLHYPERFVYLEIDATLLYTLPGQETLTEIDKLIDSPYNTYRNPGLPPGPICSPGESSLTAALDPEETDFYFYALNKDGVHQYSKTYEEHQIVVNEANAARRSGNVDPPAD